MESEENLSLKNSEKNISVENSLPSANTSKKPIEKQTESPSIINPKKNQKISTEQTQSLINIAPVSYTHLRAHET